MAMNERRRRFIDEYVIDFNATQAAIRAGYAPSSAPRYGHDLLKNPDVQVAVREKVQEIGERTAVTQDKVRKHLAALAFGDMREIAQWDEHGVRFRRSEDIEDVAALTVKEVSQKVERRYDRNGDEVITVHMSLKQHGKTEPLRMLAQHTGLLKIVPDGDPAKFERLLSAIRGEEDPGEVVDMEPLDELESGGDEQNGGQDGEEQ
jgi:phage terminase small subunit